MTSSAALVADLALLTEILHGVDSETPDLAETLRTLAADAGSAVPAYIGLTVVVATGGVGGARGQTVLRFTVLVDGAGPGDVATSLRLPLPAGEAPERPTVTVVLYAATPGAFVDMAADLTFLTGGQLADTDLDRHRELASEPDVVGAVVAGSEIHEAIGVLIARGYLPEQATAELDARAEAAGTERRVEAARILAELSEGTRPSGVDGLGFGLEPGRGVAGDGL